MHPTPVLFTARWNRPLLPGFAFEKGTDDNGDYIGFALGPYIEIPSGLLPQPTNISLLLPSRNHH